MTFNLLVEAQRVNVRSALCAVTAAAIAAAADDDDDDDVER